MPLHPNLACKKTINEPTRLTENSSSYIDLIFAFKSNPVMESGLHSSDLFESEF